MNSNLIEDIIRDLPSDNEVRIKGEKFISDIDNISNLTVERGTYLANECVYLITEAEYELENYERYNYYYYTVIFVIIQ